MDSYPQEFDCSHPTVWKPVITNYQQYHAEVNPSQPWYIPGMSSVLIIEYRLPSSQNFREGLLTHGAPQPQVRPKHLSLDRAHPPDFIGYGPCRVLTGPDFQSVFNLQLWASNAKLINYYMFYGYVNSGFSPLLRYFLLARYSGTSWGAIPFPGVYTSYDYGASVTFSVIVFPLHVY